ncbi:MAG: hypothetical protein JXA69_00780 [Phycisphaerae bacterium]|nr:hypothetical protein [Phycisphaerae bacterium]
MSFGGELVSIGAYWPCLSAWQAFLVFGVSLIVLYVAGRAYWLSAHPGRTAPQWISRLGRIVTVILFMLIYLVLHEGGHILAQAAFGCVDLASSDVLGIRGQPHAGGVYAPGMPGWQFGVISISGPMLPNLIGYLVFIVGIIPPGARRRAKSKCLNRLWSAGVFIFLLGQIGILIPIMGLGDDPDYRVFVNSGIVPIWLANLVEIALVFVNVLMIVTVIRQSLPSWRKPATPGKVGLPTKVKGT